MLEPEQVFDARCDAFAALGVRDPHAFTDADAAVTRITEIYDRGVAIVADAFERFTAGAKVERIGLVEAFYPFIGIKLERHELNLDARRSFGALHDPGIYGTTLTRPALFGEYYRRQIGLLIEHHKVPVIVGICDRRLPLPFVIEEATADIRHDRLAALEAAFALPDMRFIDDAIANGTFRPPPGEAKPLALFTAERVDYSLQRVHHYTATAPEHVQRFVLLTNYQRYVEHFIEYARDQIEHGDSYDSLVEPGDVIVSRQGLPAPC
jgi:AMP nucleosidase